MIPLSKVSLSRCVSAVESLPPHTHCPAKGDPLQTPLYTWYENCWNQPGLLKMSLKGWWRWENPFREVMIFGLSIGTVEGYGAGICKESASEKAHGHCVCWRCRRECTRGHDKMRGCGSRCGCTVRTGSFHDSMKGLWSSRRETGSRQFMEKSNRLDRYVWGKVRKCIRKWTDTKQVIPGIQMKRSRRK